MRKIFFRIPFRSECYLLTLFSGGECVVLLILFCLGFCLLVFLSFPKIHV